jgi:hypothetical protein
VQHGRERLADMAAERLVRPKEEMERLFEPESAAVERWASGASVVRRSG